nr:TlpA disulfide reductase family protein [uncultured Draconibacterium sp.]
MKKTFIIIIFLFYSLIGFSQQNLVGQKAPKIEIENWIYPKIQVADWQTKQIPKDLSGKIIVLDFWFTKCAPCVASIPELNHLVKQFPETVFLSVTFDKQELIDKFLDKMVMYYPIGSDPEQKTIRAYGVSSFPETFLIDENGIIKWQGSPFHLDKKLLNSVLGREQETTTINLNNSEIPFDNSAYSFSIQKNNLGMGQSSYYHFNPFDINVFNKDLENMLKVFYGINKSRILKKDSVLLKTTYDVTLKADKEITTQANCVDMLKYLLPEQMDFKLKELPKDTLVGLLQIENDSLLNVHNSSSQHFGTSLRYDNWESKGATIENLKDFLEDNYSILLEVKKPDDRKFDFIISANDLEKAKATLENEYGLIIKMENQEINFWEIIK